MQLTECYTESGQRKGCPGTEWWYVYQWFTLVMAGPTENGHCPASWEGIAPHITNSRED